MYVCMHVCIFYTLICDVMAYNNGIPILMGDADHWIVGTICNKRNRWFILKRVL